MLSVTICIAGRGLGYETKVHKNATRFISAISLLLSISQTLKELGLIFAAKNINS